MSEIKYEIINKIGVLSKAGSGWAKELNLISWNDREPKSPSAGVYPELAEGAPPPNMTLEL